MRPMFERYISQPEADQKVWRYMDYAKFISLLDQSALFFSQIKGQWDQMEGRIDFPPGSELERFLKERYEVSNMPWAHFVINSWHINNHESAVMWYPYRFHEGQGIAIQTTVEKLKASIQKNGMIGEVTTGRVNYGPLPEPRPGDTIGISYDVDQFYKQEEYEDEHEYRLLASAIDFAKAKNAKGVYVPVALDILIETIFTAPYGNPWFFDLVRSVASEKYQIPEDKIRRSKLDRHWLEQ